MGAGEPGWYPDPAGEPDRFRYWDGHAWSPSTTDDPRHPPPLGDVGPAGRADRRPTARRSRVGLVAGLLAVVLVGVLVAAVLLGRGGAGRTSPEPTPSPVSGDDSSPTPSGSPSASPSVSPSPGSSCPRGDPNLRDAHPADERVHGGNLSFPLAPGFGPPEVEPRLTFAYDVVEQVRAVDDDPSWIAQLAVGRVHSGDGFGASPRRAAGQLLGCIVGGELYQPYRAVRQDVRSERVTIDGRPGWLVESRVRVDQPRLAFPGDHVVVVVVTDETGYGFFFGAVPLGDKPLEAVLADAVRGLRVD